MRRFWVFLFGLTALCHVPFGLGLFRALSYAGVGGAAYIAAGASAVLVALLSGRIRRARFDHPIPAWRRALLEEPYFIHWGGTVLSLLLWPLFTGIGWALGRARATAPLLSVLDAALLAYGVSVAVAAWGVLVRRRWVRVRNLDIAIPNLPAGFEGYRIAQLSDLHIGSMSPRSVGDGWVKRVNGLGVDLVALTGDYVTSGTAFHEDIASLLSSFRATDGVLAVMGNHDYFGEGEALVKRLRDKGVQVLRNEWTTLGRGADKVTVAGVDDTWTRRADVARTLAGLDRKLPLIALAHDPSLFPKLARGGAALVLSGHTHWGQIAAPFMPTRFNLSRLSYRYHSGLYRESGSTLYINPGLGTTGPPIRLGAPPEITVLRLRREAAS